MCGLVFALGHHDVERFVREANTTQFHRGPDAQAVHFEQVGPLGKLGFAHQRLAILDLSDRGQQPMSSRSGNLLMVFNGEIYNYRDLASEYGLPLLSSASDTEVALELIEQIGIEDACQRFNGMWAIVVYDRRKKKIFLARDRFGKKPLNYAIINQTIYVASEVKSFFDIDGLELRPNLKVAARYLAQSLQNIDTHTWIESVSSFPPSSIGFIDVAASQIALQGVHRFWTPEYDDDLEHKKPSDYIAELRETVVDAIRIRLHADVPVGIALSGGIDSSIIAAISKRLQGGMGKDVLLFSATNPGSKDDESSFVEIFAKHTAAQVKQFSLDPGCSEDLYELLTVCNVANDGPVSSFSNILFYKMMEIAGQNGVTCVLTGQGADEAFCGYRKYPALEVKRLLKSGKFFAAAKFLAPFVGRGTLLPQLNFAEAKRYFGATNSSILGETSLVALEKESLGAMVGTMSDRQLLDIEKYSVPYLCHYEDRMSMAWSREVRSPFLDYRVVELGLQMPTELKMASGWTKYCLRLAFEDLLPKEITWRKDKKGFANPQDDWLGTTLKTQVLDIMSDPSAPVYQYGLVDRAGYLESFKRYCSGSKKIWFRDVFAPFSLNVWLRILDR